MRKMYNAECTLLRKPIKCFRTLLFINGTLLVASSSFNYRSMIAILSSLTALLNRSSVLYCELKVVCKVFELAIENYPFRVRVTGVVIKIVNVAMSGMGHNVNTTNFTQNNHWHYKVVVKIE